jgi:hypothetical protein
MKKAAMHLTVERLKHYAPIQFRLLPEVVFKLQQGDSTILSQHHKKPPQPEAIPIALLYTAIDTPVHCQPDNA